MSWDEAEKVAYCSFLLYFSLSTMQARSGARVGCATELDLQNS
jgi:hypothetical protein